MSNSRLIRDMQTTKEIYLCLIEDTLSYIRSLKKSDPISREALQDGSIFPKEIEKSGLQGKGGFTSKKHCKENPEKLFPISREVENQSVSTLIETSKPSLPESKTILPSPTEDQGQIKKEREAPFVLELSPPPLPLKKSFGKMRTLLEAVAPELYLHEGPISDEKAKQTKGAWREKSQIPEIPILFQGEAHRSFLDNIAKAITLSLAPSRTIEVRPYEREKKWDLLLKSPKLKLILCPDHLVFSLKELRTFYRENLSQKTHFLGNTPLLLLPNLAFYFEDPYLKRFLWNVICQTFQLLPRNSKFELKQEPSRSF